MKQLNKNMKQNFKSAAECHICEKSFSPEDNKHRDLRHLTAEYRGAAHESCNTHYRTSNVILVIFYNLSGYDSHFSIRVLVTQFKGYVSLLPINKERISRSRRLWMDQKFNFDS